MNYESYSISNELTQITRFINCNESEKQKEND